MEKLFLENTSIKENYFRSDFTLHVVSVNRGMQKTFRKKVSSDFSFKSYTTSKVAKKKPFFLAYCCIFFFNFTVILRLLQLMLGNNIHVENWPSAFALVIWYICWWNHQTYECMDTGGALMSINAPPVFSICPCNADECHSDIVTKNSNDLRGLSQTMFIRGGG